MNTQPASPAAVAKRARLASYVLILLGVFSAVFGESALRSIDAASGHTVPYALYSFAHYTLLIVAQAGVPVAAGLFAAALVLKRL
ncbi:hypothetical protein ACFY36_00230 [Actinoplanes sp. NPDC000266]